MVLRIASAVVPILLNVIWIVPIDVAASGPVILVSRRHDLERRILVERLMTIWLIASFVAVATLTLLP